MMVGKGARKGKEDGGRNLKRGGVLRFKGRWFKSSPTVAVRKKGNSCGKNRLGGEESRKE